MQHRAVTNIQQHFGSWELTVTNEEGEIYSGPPTRIFQCILSYLSDLKFYLFQKIQAGITERTDPSTALSILLSYCYWREYRNISRASTYMFAFILCHSEIHITS